MDEVAGRVADIRRRMADACQRARRAPGSARLIAVSKTFPAEAIAAAAAAGQDLFGESYVSEALDKIGLAETLAARKLEWHFIGPIQGNKCRAIAGNFDWAHGVDRLKIAARLSELRGPELPPLNVCVQINISGENSKAGVTPVEAVALCAEIERLPGLRLRGLMAIPAPVDDAEQSRPAFRQLRELHTAIRAGGKVDQTAFDTLSMGMSDDYEVAIEEGATLIRLGSAVFGSRPQKLVEAP
jgi:pyridoxal phosphate enzyme (YggS family)